MFENLMDMSYSSFTSNFSSNTLTQHVYAVNSTNSTNPVNYSGLEQHTKSFLLDMKAKNNPPINSLPPSEARAVLSGLQYSYPADMPEAVVHNQTIPVGPNNETMIQIVRPAGISENQVLPVVMYFQVVDGCLEDLILMKG